MGNRTGYPPRVLSELIAAVLVLPLAETNLRQDIDSVISASDATPSRLGVCRAVANQQFARGLYRLAEHRGEHVWVDWSALQEQHTPTRMRRPQAEVEQRIQELGWEITQERDFDHVHHVNIQELEAMLADLERRSVQPERRNKRFVILVDSRVAVGCWAEAVHHPGS